MPSAHSAWLKFKLKCSNATSLLDACLRKSVFGSCAAYRAIRIQTPTSRIASCLFFPVRTGFSSNNGEPHLKKHVLFIHGAGEAAFEEDGLTGCIAAKRPWS